MAAEDDDKLLEYENRQRVCFVGLLLRRSYMSPPTTTSTSPNQASEDLMSVISKQSCSLMLKNIFQSLFVGIAAALLLLDW